MVKAFKHFKKINNKGSALVTVIVVAGLLTIMATTLLFVAVRNYKSRQIDYISKKNFYEAEKTLDELRSLLIEDCSESCSKAYVDVLNDYMNLSADERLYKYNDQFVNYEYDIWLSRNVNMNYVETVKAMLGEELGKNIESVEQFDFQNSEGYMLLKGVVISASSEDGYYSRIKTDIKIDAPKINWADGAGNVETRTINMYDYVSYVNWQRD